MFREIRLLCLIVSILSPFHSDFWRSSSCKTTIYFKRVEADPHLLSIIEIWVIVELVKL